MTQDEFKLFTNQTVSYNDTDWALLVNIAENRLASFLCLSEFPELDESNQDLAMLLANFLAATLKFAGNSDTISSKSVRNFTIQFKSSATNAFEQIYSQYEDIIEKYSKCGTEIKVEKNACHYCCGRFGGYNGLINF